LKKEIKISIIIAVYQRQEELTELLQSLGNQTFRDFEIIVVDDGSPQKLQSVVDNFSSQLNLKYFYKENSGPAQSRNFGMKHATGNYFIFLDSDTIAPKDYLQTVFEELNSHYVDAFGGPDAADENFSDLQKAISFSMTSFLTTGGIRGGKKHVGKFQPRSFNMGISKEAFEKTGGFGELRIGEDPDLSMTLWGNGFETRLFPEAKVFHKRRTSLKKFAKQVYQFGVARPILNQRHPQYNKLTFWFPSLFLGYFSVCVLGILYAFLSPLFWDESNSNMLFAAILNFPLFVYFFLILIFSFIQFNSFKISVLSLVSSIVQFIFYGFGFMKSWICLNVFKLNPKKIFPNHFSS